MVEICTRSLVQTATMLTLQIMDGCYNLIRDNKTGLNGTTERAGLRIKNRAPHSWGQAPMGLTASRKREFKAGPVGCPVTSCRLSRIKLYQASTRNDASW